MPWDVLFLAVVARIWSGKEGTSEKWKRIFAARDKLHLGIEWEVHIRTGYTIPLDDDTDNYSSSKRSKFIVGVVQ